MLNIFKDVITMLGYYNNYTSPEYNHDNDVLLMAHVGIRMVTNENGTINLVGNKKYIGELLETDMAFRAWDDNRSFIGLRDYPVFLKFDSYALNTIVLYSYLQLLRAKGKLDNYNSLGDSYKVEPYSKDMKHMNNDLRKSSVDEDVSMEEYYRAKVAIDNGNFGKNSMFLLNNYYDDIFLSNIGEEFESMNIEDCLPYQGGIDIVCKSQNKEFAFRNVSPMYLREDSGQLLNASGLYDSLKKDYEELIDLYKIDDIVYKIDDERNNNLDMYFSFAINSIKRVFEEFDSIIKNSKTSLEPNNEAFTYHIKNEGYELYKHMLQEEKKYMFIINEILNSLIMGSVLYALTSHREFYNNLIEPIEEKIENRELNKSDFIYYLRYLCFKVVENNVEDFYIHEKFSNEINNYSYGKIEEITFNIKDVDLISRATFQSYLNTFNVEHLDVSNNAK